MIRTGDIKKFIVNKKSTIKEVLKVIDQNKDGIALVVEKDLRLLGTITDGDVRRFILKNGDINLRCDRVINTRYVYTKKDSIEEVKRLMGENRIRHIPLLGKGKKLIKFFISDTIYDFHQRLVAVVMAGGEGRRLRKISRNVPKPLVKIKQKPILEDIILGLKSHNIKEIYLALRYKAQSIKDYFKDGSKLGVTLNYLVEKKTLGTAGALSLIPENKISEAILVINADLLTTANYTSLIDFYYDHHLLMCIAVKEYIFDIPYGVLDISNGYLIGVKEKPSLRSFCNAGIYVLNTRILKLIPKNKEFHMTDLIKLLIHKSLPIGVFPLYEYWIDIGNIDDFHKAKSEYDSLFRRRSYE